MPIMPQSPAVTQHSLVICIEGDALIADLKSFWVCILEGILKCRAPDNIWKDIFTTIGNTCISAAHEIISTTLQEYESIENHKLCKACADQYSHLRNATEYEPHLSSIKQLNPEKDNEKCHNVLYCSKILFEELSKVLYPCVKPEIGIIQALNALAQYSKYIIIATNNVEFWEMWLSTMLKESSHFEFLKLLKVIQLEKDMDTFKSNLMSIATYGYTGRSHNSCCLNTGEKSPTILGIASSSNFYHYLDKLGIIMYSPNKRVDGMPLVSSLEDVLLEDIHNLVYEGNEKCVPKLDNAVKSIAYSKTVEPLRMEHLLKHNQDDTRTNDIIRKLWQSVIILEAPIYVTGTVISGFGRGSKLLGIPTANVDPKDSSFINNLIPGVYFGWATLSGELYANNIYKMVMSLGYNPYFHNATLTIEPYLFNNFDEEFTGSPITLLICGYIRAESSFPKFEHLIQAIQYDCDVAYMVLNNKIFLQHRNMLEAKSCLA